MPVARVTPTVMAAHIHTGLPTRKVFEPEYLDSAGIVPSTYPPINIQLKGYDFDILESYQSYVHNLAENIGLGVAEAWATPCTSLNVHTYAEGSTSIKESYKLHLYERNVHLENVQCTDLPVLIDLLRRTVPEGVKLSIHEHKAEHYEARFIPDPFIDGIRSELNTLEEEKQKQIDKSMAEKAAKGKK